MIKIKNVMLKKYNFKLFICFCGKIYKAKDNLIWHYKNIHLGKNLINVNFAIIVFFIESYYVQKFPTKIFPYKCLFNKSKYIFLCFF